MNTITKTFTLLFLGVATSLFSQNQPATINHGSNFKITVAPTLGYISFDQNQLGINADNLFFGSQFSFYTEKATLKKRYLRTQLSYMYHFKRFGNHDYINNQFVTFNPEYFFRLGDAFELGGGIALGLRKQGASFPYSIDVARPYPRNPFIQFSKGLTITGLYDFKRFFTSITLGQHIIGSKNSKLLNNPQSTSTQVLMRLGVKL